MSNLAALERRGGRRGGFEKKKAVKVGEMRQTKACLRCLFYRIECDDGDPCAQCRRRMRTWKLPCTRRRLPERLVFLFPDILTAHLQRDRVYACMGTNAKKDLHEQRPFHIPLTQFLEEVEQKYLWLQVREVKPAGPMVLAAKHQSPPLIPYVVAEREQVEEQVSENLELWLQRFLDDRGSDWQWYVFPKLVEQAWERNILGQICYLLNPSNIEHKTLQVAMELTLFNHLLTHSFTVPDGHIEWLYNKKLQHPHYKNHTPLGVEVCPGAVNAFLAMIILHKVEVQAKLTLEHIDEPFVSRDDSMLTGTLVFCESFLFVMVLAQLQNSVLEHAKMDSNVYETTISIEEAKQLMKTMEDELATPVIELCVFKLRKVFKKRKSEASAPSNRELESSTDESMTRFFDNLHKITESCATTLNKQTDLGNIHAYMFGARNVQRMLKKLYDAVSPFFAAPDPLHIALD